MNKFQVAILAGGKGTRLAEVVKDVPKPMVKIGGISVLESQIIQCKVYGLTNILLLVSYKSKLIREYFNDGSAFGLKIDYAEDIGNCGTAGALAEILDLMSPDFLILYGDTYFDVDLNKLINFHHKKKSYFTFYLHPNSHPKDSDQFQINDLFEIKKIFPYSRNENILVRNMASAAMHVANRDYLKKTLSSHIQKNVREKNDLIKDIFSKIEDYKNLYGYYSCEYIKDMGTPERLKRVQSDVNRNIPIALSSRVKRRAIFLDRDGTINIEKNYITNKVDIELIEGASEAIYKINNNGYLALVVTNQPIISFGWIGSDELEGIHAQLEMLLSQSAYPAYLDKIYYCPHHPDRGYKGEISNFKIHCDCRKPNTELILRAISEFNIDVSQSWFIGDSTSDVLAGKSVGLKTILVETGFGGKDKKYKVTPDFKSKNILEAVNFSINIYDKYVDLAKNLIDNIKKSKIIYIYGLSRSGKSTFSYALRDAFSMIGISNVKILHLDNWLIDNKKRKNITNFEEKYNLKDLLNISKNFFSGENCNLEMANNNSFSCEVKDQIIFNNTDILIFEGIPAISLVKYFGKGINIYIEMDEKKRLSALKRDYLRIGKNISEIDKIIEDRNIEKISIENQKYLADFIIKI